MHFSGAGEVFIYTGEVFICTAGEVFIHFSGAGEAAEAGEAGEVFIYTPAGYIPATVTRRPI